MNQDNALIVVAEELHLTKETPKNILKGAVRFDRNLAKNGISFAKFGEDGDLMFDLVVYFANTYQNNLFAHGMLDIEDFCRTMNYSKSNLLKSHKNPRQFQESAVKKSFSKLTKSLDMPNGQKSEGKELYYHTVLDNALYRLSDEGISFRFYAQNNEVISSATTSIKIVKLLAKKFIPSTKAKNKDLKKLHYTFVLDNDFTDNLTKYFVNIDLTSVSLLRKSNSVYLYAYLKNLQMDLHSKGLTYTNSLDFNMLCELAQIEVENSSDLKKKLRTKLNNIFMITDLKGKVDFVKRPGDSYAFQPVITYFNNLPKLQSAEYSQQVASAVRTRFLHEVKAQFIEKKDRTSFKQYLYDVLGGKDDNPLYVEVRKMAVKSYAHVCKEDMRYGDGRVSYILTSLFNEIKASLEKKISQ